MRGAVVITSPTHFATAALYNNSTGAYVLVVRDLNAVTNGFPIVASLHGTIGTHTGTEAPLITGEAVGPGLVYSLDDASAITPDYALGSFTQFHDFPYAVIYPGWSLVVQDTVAAVTVPAPYAFIWEYIEPDELDWLY